MSWAKLNNDDAERLATLPPDAIAAVHSDLSARMYSDPHSDAYIDTVRLKGGPDSGYRIAINVRVIVSPSADAINSFYQSGMEGTMRAPCDHAMTHTILMELPHA